MVALPSIPAVSMRSCLCILLLTATVNGQGFYQARGSQIVDPDGEVFLPKGISLNGYLFPDVYGLKLYNDDTRVMNSPSQAYKKIGEMIGNVAREKEFWDAYHENFLTMEDLKHLADQGFNAIRLPFNYRMLSPWEAPGTYVEDGFNVLDKIIGWCKQNNLAVLLDMHSAPGGQSHEGYADPEHSYWYWHYELAQWRERGVQVLFEDNSDYTANTGRTAASNQQRTADIWREIAKRYAEEDIILGYELLNEPYWYPNSTPDDTVREFYISVTSAIRQVDKNHMILVEGNLFGEEIDGLLPPWDSNMAIAFHRFWRETGYEDGRVQEYIYARDEHNVPFMLTESGENSNPWNYEVAQLMESNNMGWFFKGYKKVDSIACAYEVLPSENYQYVMANWNDPSEVDQNKAYKGLMDLAEALETENCHYEPGFFAALLEKNFNKKSRQYAKHMLPGIVQASDYDIGNQGIAYSDAKYKQNAFDDGPWNGGWYYRNDGVDIYASDNDEKSNGFHVSGISAGEWIRYTVHVENTGSYRLSFRLASTWGRTGKIGVIQLFGGDQFQTEPIDVVANGPKGSWWTQTEQDLYTLERGKLTLELFFLEGDVKIAWMNFEKRS